LEFNSELKSQINHNHKLAKKAYESGDMISASRYYGKCAQLMQHLAEASSGKQKGELTQLAAKYRDIAQGLLAGEVRLRSNQDITPPSSAEIQRGKSAEAQPQSHDAFIREQVMQKNKDGLPSWNDIGGLKKVKELIKKSVVLGIIENKPEAVEACNAILFYGPPGTGKTLMAAAVAKNIEATFFDVKVSQMLSKYLGEGPKIMSSLFKVAREEAPSVVFIDEFDSIALSRSGDMHEETRRGLSTLLSELDGLQSKSSSKKFVLVIVATNTPESIDEAIMSRFGKKIEITLPDIASCIEILKIHTEKKGIALDDKNLYDRLASYCVGKKLSGRDIKFLCSDAISRMVDEMNPNLEELAQKDFETIRKYQLRTRRLKESDFKLSSSLN
jgi:katanin p60 ATPase-containing subunit A1